MPDVTVIIPNPALPEDIPARKKRRVAGYARVSTDHDEQFTSYEAQVEYYTRFIRSNPAWEFVKVYTDEGVTGTSTKKRAGFQSMVRDALEGKIDLIITKSVSRFARNTVDSLSTIRLLKEIGTEVYFEKENIWTFDGKGELLITIMSSIAQEESRSISANVTWGIREAMRRGKAWVPYKVFLGYIKGGDGSMVTEPRQAMLVRRIYGMFMQGKSPYRICRELEAEGVEFSEGQRRWYPTTVKSILMNEKYKGDALRQKTYVKNYLTKETVPNRGELQQYYIRGHHEAIISEELFERVQNELRRRGTVEIKREGAHLLSLGVKCGLCGAWYGKNTAGGKSVWRCMGRYGRARTGCASEILSEDELKQAFVSAVNARLSSENELNAESFAGNAFTTEGLEWERRELLPELESADELRKSLAEERIREIGQEIALIYSSKTEFLAYISALSAAKRVENFTEKLWRSLSDHLVVYSRNSIKAVFRDGSEFWA